MNLFNKTVIAGLVSTTGMIGIAGSAQSQEQLTHYDSVKGWSVNSYKDNRRFLGCDAQIASNGWLLRIGFDGKIWAIGTQSNQQGIFPGNLEIDGRNAQVNYEHFPDGWAMVQMTVQEVRNFRNGSRVGVDIGRGYVDFSLSGSAAAMTKVEECFANSGHKPRQRIVQNNQFQPSKNQQPVQQNQRVQRQQNQNPVQSSQNNKCRKGEQYLPKSGLCTNEARRYLNISAGEPMQPLDGCSMAVNEAALPGQQFLLYKALRCNNVTTKLEFSAGARNASLSLVVSGYDAGNGVNPVVTEPIRDVTIGAIHNADAYSSLLSMAKGVMEAQDKKNACRVVSGQPFGFPADSLLVHTRDKPLPNNNQNEPSEDGFECGSLGYLSDSNSYWRSFGGYNWYFELGQDLAQYDPNTFTVVEQDKADQWVAVP